MRLLDPHVFSYVIMTLYATNVGHYALQGMWNFALYWFFALGITATVTFR